MLFSPGVSQSQDTKQCWEKVKYTQTTDVHEKVKPCEPLTLFLRRLKFSEGKQY